jgi:putative two-component system response regulator
MNEKSLLELLKESGPHLPEQGRDQIRGALAPILARVREPWAGSDDATEIVDQLFALCRMLYGAARSGEALALVQALLDQPQLRKHDLLMRRTAIMCGIFSADSGDIPGAMEYYVRALRLAIRANDHAQTGTVWNNIGNAMMISGHHDMAVRAYERTMTEAAHEPRPSYSRYHATGNLASSHFHLGNIEEGLRYGELWLQESTAGLRERDLYAAILYHRNLVRLYVAAGRAEAARPFVDEALAMAGRTPSQRARIAAATTQSFFELATGNVDVALTRLDQALARAREVPAALHDTLVCTIRAEEAAGDPARALLRLDELSRHIYAHALERAKQYVELEAVAEGRSASLEHRRAQDKARLTAKLPPPSQPEGWKALRRLAVGAAMQTEVGGWHGMRVGALVKALAIEFGVPPLQALEMGHAAELHDIGMISVPQGILLKKGPLNEAEKAIVRKHIEAGDELLRTSRHPRLLLARDIARYHHAHWDGSGYPERVGGAFIPLAARICAIADAYDMVVCGYGSTPPRSMTEGLAELQRCAGTEFDPALVSCFHALIRREAEDRGMDLATDSGLEGFQDLIASLKENRGFV